jgi:hypothetical protein
MKDRSTYRQIVWALFPLLGTGPAQASTWFFPAWERPAELWVINSSSQTEVVWLSPPHRDGNLENEKSLEVPPRGRIQIPLADFPSESFAQIKSQDSKAISVYLKQNGRWDPVPEGRSSRRRLHGQIRAEALIVTNISPIRQEGLIRFQSREGVFLPRKFSLEGFAAEKISLPDAEISDLEVTGQASLLAHVVSPGHIQFLSPERESAFSSPANGARFLVANSDRSLSYVVQIEDPDLIRQAREQIAHPNDFRARILIGEIAEGAGDTNQDRTHRLQGSWSWHVSKVLTFAEFASQSCDGSPEFVEDFLTVWLQTRSPICFWNYRIVEEL